MSNGRRPMSAVPASPAMIPRHGTALGGLLVALAVVLLGPGVMPLREACGQAPPGFSAKTSGNVTLQVPDDWQADRFRAEDEGGWFLGNQFAPDASFTIVRDTALEQLAAGLTVEKKSEVAVSGQPADRVLGKVESPIRRGKRILVVLKRPIPNVGLVAFDCFATDEKWATCEPLFE